MSTPTKEWQDWLSEEEASISKLDVQIRPLDAIFPWKMQHDGFLNRDDKAFFTILGIQVTDGNSKRWTQPILKVDDSPHGYIFIVVNEIEEVLIRARREPGIRKVVLSAPFQASRPNLTVMKKVKPTIDLKTVTFFTIPQDGDRHLNKCNEVGFVKVRKEDVELLSHERWFTFVELKQALAQGKLGDHVMQALSVYMLMSS